MEEILAVVVVMVFVGGCLAMGFWFWRRTFMQVEAQWLQVAKDLNWEIMISPSSWRWLQRQYPAMKGSLNGMQVACIMSPTGSGYSMAKTKVTVVLENPTNYEMIVYNISPQNRNGDFNQRFKVESEQHSLEKQLFTKVVQQLFLDKGHLLTNGLCLVANELTYSTTVQVKTAQLKDDFIEILELSTKLAQYIQDLRKD